MKMNKNNENSNPYLNGKLVWADYLGSMIGSRNLWIVVALISLCCCLTSISGIIYIGSQSKFIPYIIEVDKLGQVQNMGIANQYGNTMQNPKIINLMLNDIIIDYRTVSVDNELTTQRLTRLYAKLQDNAPAKSKISEYLASEINNPYLRNSKESVSVIVRSILKTTQTTYTIEWTEYVRNLSGQVISESNWKGIFTIQFLDVSNKGFDELLNNPVGLYLQDFDIQRID